ncbi:hypothetical protein J3R83DRAFT_1414 [Lanmaoa asiatica]|nr:hypothetical protein J3R83DRAFT_1414 [Lanmaoa asiatica]
MSHGQPHASYRANLVAGDAMDTRVSEIVPLSEEVPSTEIARAFYAEFIESARKTLFRNSHVGALSPIFTRETPIHGASGRSVVISTRLHHMWPIGWSA